MTHLITSFNHSSPRLDEFLFCLSKNLSNHLISSISVFSDIPIKNTIHIYHPQRPTFKTLVNYANTLNDFVVITNADIYFDETIPTSLPKNYSICLTRNHPPIDINNPTTPSYWQDPYANLSFDSFFFNAPIKLNNIDFPMGIPGCDNRFAYEFVASGSYVVNPAKIINSFHVHLNPTNHKENIQGQYARVNLTESLEYNKDNVSVGWSEGLISHYPDDWKWITNLSNRELRKHKIPKSIKEYYGRF